MGLSVLAQILQPHDRMDHLQRRGKTLRPFWRRKKGKRKLNK